MKNHAKLRDADGAFVQAVLESWLWKKVSSDGFFDELRIRNVVVEGTDEVVAVLVSVWDLRIAFGAVGLGVADPVHEVAGPFFAVGGAGEKGINCVFERRQ
jgi:hypothetical protein